MSATELLVWGLVAHLVADWLLQNEWMAINKVNWRHPAGYVHAGIHGLVLWLVFPWYGALALAVAHFLIDLRWPVVWWSKLIRQTQPEKIRAYFRTPQGHEPFVIDGDLGAGNRREHKRGAESTVPYADDRYDEFTYLYSLGTEVRFWTDQVFHIACIAVAALVIG